MRTIAFLFAVAACSGGTKKTADTPAPPTSSLLDCSKVADHVATTVASNKPRPGATHATVKELVQTRCTADAWSDETKQCLHAIKTIKEGRECAAKMTDAQRTAIKTAARALRKDAAEPVADADDHSSDWIKHVVEEPGTPTR
jgi:hypothetical protein